MGLRTRTAAAVAAPLLVGVLAAPAAASPTDAARSATPVTGGVTALTINPGVAGVLGSAGIAPSPIAPATAKAVHTSAGPTLRYTFPITSGSLDLNAVSGAINHSGGLTFTNTANKKSLAIRGFRVVLGASPKLTGYVPALGVRIPVFDLGLGNASITPTSGGIRVDRVAAKLTATAAQGLNSALGTSVFAAGLRVGTASVTADLG